MEPSGALVGLPAAWLPIRGRWHRTRRACRARSHPTRHAGAAGLREETPVPNPRIKDEAMYEALREEGASKEKQPALPMRPRVMVVARWGAVVVRPTITRIEPFVNFAHARRSSAFRGIHPSERPSSSPCSASIRPRSRPARRYRLAAGSGTAAVSHSGRSNAYAVSPWAKASMPAISTSWGTRRPVIAFTPYARPKDTTKE